ncbi:hypothetical protein LTR92_001219 [Exophiala xenobiotica]|nr:hypothetical protein LTR92_001219 [Exophiala xenobiotica]
MATTPQSRLNRLFAGQPLPSPPQPGEVHFSVKELEQKAAKDQSQTWKIPATAEYPRKIIPPPKPTGADVLSSSEDEDDYVGAFRQKPSMISPTKQFTKSKPNPKDTHIEPNRAIEYIPQGKISFKAAKEHAVPESFNDNEGLPTSNAQGAPVIGHFCQFFLAAKFPYKYMNDRNDRVSKRFFADNKFFNRTWDIYYLNPPSTLSSKAIVLVPHSQVQNLVDEIGQTFKVPVFVPEFPFTLTFCDDGTPQPQHLGTSNSRDEFNTLHNSIPPSGENHGGCPGGAPQAAKQNFAAFREKCQDALAASKKKGGATTGKKPKEDDRLLAVRDWKSQLRRTQRYLGLRRKSVRLQPDADLSWAEEQEIRKKAIMEPLNIHSPAPHPFEKEPVIISVDVESYERAHNLITEVGISTLDTLDLADTAPGENGRNWINQIRSRHFRIKGRQHLVNKDFCVGNPDAFQFGSSEWADLQEAPAVVDSCFEWPFSVQYKHAGLEDPWDLEPANHNSASGDAGTGTTNRQRDGTNRAAIASVLDGLGNSDAITEAILKAETDRDPKALQRGSKERNILLVGHDIRSDLEYLRILGSKIFKPSRGAYPVAAMEAVDNGDGVARILGSILEALDTAPLYKAFKEEPQPRNLASIATDLGLQCYFMHNGGNDARYTLEALIAMVVKARLKEGEKEAGDGANSEVKGSFKGGLDGSSVAGAEAKASPDVDGPEAKAMPEADGLLASTERLGLDSLVKDDDEEWEM